MPIDHSAIQMRIKRALNEQARYPDGSLWWVIILYELRGDKVAKSTAFFAPTFEAPDWRKPYVDSKSA